MYGLGGTYLGRYVTIIVQLHYNYTDIHGDGHLHVSTE